MKPLKKARDIIIKDLKSNPAQKADYDISQKIPNHDLGGIDGIFKYLRDYSIVFTGGLLGGNLTATFLGSYQIHPVIISNIDRDNCTAEVYFGLNNTSGLESASRFPITGYLGKALGVPTATLQDMFSWKFGIPSGVLNNNAFGPVGQNADQTLHWGEEIDFK